MKRLNKLSQHFQNPLMRVLVVVSFSATMFFAGKAQLVFAGTSNGVNCVNTVTPTQTWKDANFNYETYQYVTTATGSGAQGIDAAPGTTITSTQCDNQLQGLQYTDANGQKAIHAFIGPVTGAPQPDKRFGAFGACTPNNPDASIQSTVATCSSGGYESAYFDDGGQVLVTGTAGTQQIACQTYITCAPTPTSPIQFPGQEPPSNEAFDGAGFVFSNFDGKFGVCPPKSAGQCDTQWLTTPGKTNDLTGLIGTNAAGELSPFTLTTNVENTINNGFQAIIYITYEFPLSNNVCSGNACPGPVVTPGAPPYSCDSDTVTGFASDPSNPGGPVTVYYTIDGVPPPQTAPNTNGNFTINMSKYADGSAHTVSVFAVGTSGTLGTVTDITFGPCGVAPPPPGTAACIMPLTLSPDQPWDPGEQVSITARVEFTPPASPVPDPIPPVPGAYTTTTVNNETVSITAPGWAARSNQTAGISAAPGNPSHTDSVTFTGPVPTTAPNLQYGPFDITWTFSYNATVVTHYYIWVPGFSNKFGTFPGFWSPQQTSSTNDFNNALPAPCTQTGTVPPGGGSTAKPNQEIVNKPYVRVYGGDVAVGDDFCTPATPTGGITMASILGWTKEGVGLTTWSGGAASQLAAEATANGGTGGIIGAFASSGLVSGGNTKAPPTGLSFSNVPPYNTYVDGQPQTGQGNESYGGGMVQLPDGTCQTDYYDQMPDDAQTYNGTLTAGIWTSPSPITLGTGGSILSLSAGQETTLYVKGNVTINGNIQFNNVGSGVNESVTNAPELPSFTLIVQGDINIAPNVTQLDGNYIAEPGGSGTGTINTCDADPTQTNYGDLCNNQLVINGSLLANKVNLGRTYGTVDQSSASETSSGSSAAEVINYNPLVWMQTQTTLGQSYDSISSLPPVSP